MNSEAEQAEALLARIEAGDLSAVEEYAQFAEAHGWPCEGMTWQKWAAEMAAELLVSRFDETERAAEDHDARLEALHSELW